MSSPTSPISMLIPDFPFPFDEYVRHPAGIGSVPDSEHGTRVAVIGGGMAGLTAAYELMKMGLRPVIYESAEIGGRLRGKQFGQDGPVADLGGMRFPLSGQTFFHYVDKLGIQTSPFPNPLTDASSSTVIDLAGRTYYAECTEDLPAFFHEVGAAWTECLEERSSFAEMQEAIRSRDLPAIKKLWNEIVPQLDGMSFYHYLESSQVFSRLPFQYREAFGQVGFGTGGWDTNFPDSMLEILRIIYVDAENNHRRIHGGARSVPYALWSHAPQDIVHWPVGTSLSTLHGGATLPAAVRIRRVGGTRGPIEVVDRWDRPAEYAAVVVTCQSWLLSARIECANDLFSSAMWMAIERSHYMQASKTFVMVDRPFWKDKDPITGRDIMSTTLSDRITRGTYLIDDGPDKPALICLSYTWNDDALKWMTLSVDERVRTMIRSLRKIYADVDIESHIMGEPVTVSWESDPNFMGAFSDNLPGHYRYQERLYSHFMQSDFDAGHRGIFLAGDDISWTGGWVEGAVTTALNAVWGVMHRLGGKTDPDNPGPGDLFETIRPVLLD